MGYETSHTEATVLFRRNQLIKRCALALKGGHLNGAGWPFCLVRRAAGRGKAGKVRAGSSWEPTLAREEGAGPGPDAGGACSMSR